jgi:hypothetical protein
MNEFVRDDFPLVENNRLELERASRAMIRRVFDAALEDKWTTVHSVYREAQDHSDWMAVAVWAGLPNTVKDRIRELDNDQRRTG